MAGAQTRFAGAMLSIIVALTVLVAGGLARFIPLASLAAILFVVAYGLIDWRYFRRVLHTDRADGWVCGLTFAATLLIPLEYAVFVGVFFNLALYLRRASRLHMAEMVRTPAGPFQERPLRDRIGEQPVMFLQLEGDLFFGVADELQSRLNKIANSPVRVVVLRMKRTHFVDSTVLHVLEQFAENMKSRDRHVLLCGIDAELIDRLQSYGLVDQIGPENIFRTRYGVFTSAKMALRRAEQLVGHSIDTDTLTDEDLDDTEGWTYVI
jgi:SulP family sulfate permease